MELKNKQNIILIIIILAIVTTFSISNYMKKQKIYLLSGQAQGEATDYNNKGNKNEDLDRNIFEQSQTKDKIIVHIEGEVVNPGVYRLDRDARVFDAVDIAGGLSKNADRKRINLAKKIVDEEYIYIAHKDEGDLEIDYRDNLFTSTSAIENTNLININRANIIELKELPGIGDVLANRIIEYREEKGGFKSIEDLKNVSGIGDKKFEDIKDKVSLN